MENYKTKIMETNRHQIIYSYTESRKELFEQLVDEYKIKANENHPMAIYLDKIGLPNIEYKDLNQAKLSTLAREFLYFSIAEKIMMNISSQINLSEIGESLAKYLLDIGLFHKEKITDLNRFIKLLNISKQFYKEYYNEYVKNGKSKLQIDDLEIPFLEIEFFANRIKKLLNNDSYFSIILDNQEPIALISQQIINNLIGCRINNKMSIKLATNPDDWKTYHTGFDYIENIHDYEIITLDDSYQKTLKQYKSKHV